MRTKSFGLAAVLVAASAAVCLAQDAVPQSGPARNGEPAWFIQPPRAAAAAPDAGVPGAVSAARPRRGGGRSRVSDACNADIEKLCSGKAGAEAQSCLQENSGTISKECKPSLEGARFRVTGEINIPICEHSPVCTASTGAGIGNLNNPDGVRGGVGGYIRVEWKSKPVNLGWKPAYPIHLPSEGT